MKVTLLCALLTVAACGTKPNPDACCTTQQQCDALNLSGITSCKTGNVCNGEGACVATECTTSADCTSTDKPVCINQLCVAKCSVDDDCTGLAGTPHCGTDGACVACVDDTQCTADAPICDAQQHSCRGCTVDSECTGGICIEATGACEADVNVVYVRSDGVDTGECTSSAPCLTLTYAFTKLTSARNVVHLMGGTFNAGSNAVELPGRVMYIDGEDTVVRNDASTGPVLNALSQFVSATIESVKLGTSVSGKQSITVGGGTVELYDVAVQAPFAVTGGSLELSHSSTLPALSVTQTSSCTTGGALSIHDSMLHGDLKTMNCTTTIARNHIDMLSSGVSLSGTSVVIVENNVISSSDYFTDALFVGGTTGSTVRFNTFANTSGVDMGAQALSCQGMVAVTSNIFAWHSNAPPGNCAATYSLFDQVVGLQPGTGNHAGDASTFFVDMAAQDFHLAAGSPAKGIGEMGLPVATDIDGNARPQPSGSQPDVGAYEAP